MEQSVIDRQASLHQIEECSLTAVGCSCMLSRKRFCSAEEGYCLLGKDRIVIDRDR